MKKGIILAGGSGTRLYPLSQAVSKQLQRVYDKPMIYYPLSTLMYAGVRDICIVGLPRDLADFETLLGDGTRWGVRFCYREQPRPEGIAQALLLARDFIAKDPVALILGDNLFHGSFDFAEVFRGFREGAHIFAHRVKDPERYGVVELDDHERVVSLQEKPASPRSSCAVTGLYLFEPGVVEICEQLTPGPRGELEVTDVNQEYLRRGQLSVSHLGRGMTWLDMGTVESLHEASNYVRILETRQGVKIGCPEELALRKGFIGLDRLEALVGEMPRCEYRDYLDGLLEECRGGR
jgi:glucose-1-phosphate thymidylyltransferase